MQKSTFKKYIKSLNEDELREEIDRLFSKIPEVKHYYTLELGSDADRKRIYDKVKRGLESKYRTKSFRRPRRPRIAKINAILREVEKHALYTFELGDVFLYNVECATAFANKYYFESDPLTNVILKSYEKGCLYIRDALMEDEFEDRLKEVIVNMKRYPNIAISMEQLYDRIIEA
jgi:hypothetical protein